MIDFLSQNIQVAFAVGVLFGMLLMWAAEEDLKNGRGAGHGA